MEHVKFIIKFKKVFKICGYIILNHYADQQKILQSFMSRLTFMKHAEFRFENIFFLDPNIRGQIIKWAF